MKIPDFSVSLKCLFCGSVLEGPDDAEYQSGDLIECTSCGESNDYDSVLEVAKGEGEGKVKEMVEDHLKKEFKDIFKKK